MSHGAGGLSDVLRDMAEREAARSSSRESLPPPQPGRPRRSKRSGKVSVGGDATRSSRGDIASKQTKQTKQSKQGHAGSQNVTSAAGSKRSGQTGAVAMRRIAMKRDPLHAAAVPVFLLMAALLLVPGAWAVLLLAGYEVWRSDWQGSQTMAMSMMACFPIAALLVVGAWYFRKQPGPSRPVRVPTQPPGR